MNERNPMSKETKLLDDVMAALNKAEAELRSRDDKYIAEKRCCTICDAKKVCTVCGDATLYACSDCRIDFQATVYVCGKKACRDEHELKCSARLREKLRSRDEAGRELLGAIAKYDAPEQQGTWREVVAAAERLEAVMERKVNV